MSGPSACRPRSASRVESHAVSQSPQKLHISTHVLDIAKGRPVGGLSVKLYKFVNDGWILLNESNTDSNGRCADLADVAKFEFTGGRYKIHFDVETYFRAMTIDSMYPFVEVAFDVKNSEEHYHVPVLLSPFGYSTYRGS